MERIIIPSQWAPTDGIMLEKNANLAVRFDSNILVVAGPGAGKTELLAQKAGFLFQTNTCTAPRKILAISFKTDAATNLKERIHSRYGKEYALRFSSLTYDAFAKKIVDQFIGGLPTDLRPSKDYSVEDKSSITEAFKKVGYNNPRGLSPSRLNAEHDKILSSTPLPLNGNNIGEKVWRLLLKGFDNTSSCLSFKMISKLAKFLLLSNPLILQSLRKTYSHVFLDEFQDTTSLQYDLVKTCFHKSSSLITAVGDNKQRIMVWAGARETIFEDFEKDFFAQRTSLLMNHRSAPRLVELQKLMYCSLKETPLNLKTSSKWNDDDGNIILFISDKEELEAQFITNDIKEKINNGIPLNEMCILVKQMPDNYISILIACLNEQHIRARIETEYQDLLKEPIVRLLLDMLSLSLNRRNPDKWEFINDLLYEIMNISPEINQELYQQEHKKLISILDHTKNNLTACANKNELQYLINDLIDFCGTANIKAFYPAYSQGNNFETKVNRLIDLLWDEFNGCNEWISSIENLQGLHSIPIMTIHKSKGLEYTAVYFIGLEDGAFWNFRNQPEEDRCAFFVALSRAREFVSFFYCSYRHKLKNPNQHHNNINEFFDLLQTPGIASVINCTQK